MSLQVCYVFIIARLLFCLVNVFTDAVQLCAGRFDYRS